MLCFRRLEALAEQAAFEFVEKNDVKFDLTTVLPSGVRLFCIVLFVPASDLIFPAGIRSEFFGFFKIAVMD